MEMWSELQNAGVKRCATGTGGCGCDAPAHKVARWEDSIARLEAVAAGAGEWRRDDACRRRWGWCAGRCGAHDTIRAENGKSYLELGAAARGCCDGRAGGRCASRRCYRDRRFKMMNLCAHKLARLRQTPDPPLRRSVLVCNALRRIEREAERDAAEDAPPTFAVADAFRDPAAGRATPFPSPAAPDCDSGYGDEERARPIDWGSVLSLSALDPLNNNEGGAGGAWGAWGAEEWRVEREADDTFARLLVGTS